MLKMANGIVIGMKTKGDFDSTFKFLKKMKERSWLRNLDVYGRQGVEALAKATPKDTGLTANSWNYDISDDGETLTLTWYNTNVVKDYYNVALYIQYGHGTKNGGWVEGIDYINPALRPIFEKISGNIWEEITTS